MTNDEAIWTLQYVDFTDPTFYEAISLAIAALRAQAEKVGDTVYQTDGIRIYESKVKRILHDTDNMAFDERAIGKTVFLTREEAEAALEAQKGMEEESLNWTRTTKSKP